MSVVLYRLGRWAFRHRRRVLGIWLAVLVVLGGLAVTLRQPYDDGFSIPGAPAVAAYNQLAMTFPQAATLTATAIIVLPEGSNANDPATKALIEQAVKTWSKMDGVESVTSPYNDMISGLITEDGRAAIVKMSMVGSLTDTTDAQRSYWQDVTSQIASTFPAGTTVRLGGDAFSVDLPGLSVIEALGVIVALVVLLITFGSLVAAGLPLLTALFGVILGMAVVTIATGLAAINSTTPMLAVMLGLAVGIDYALFIASRHRDQLGQGMDPEESAARSVATAGSAVVFAGLTVIIALVGLAVANIPFLTVMGAFAAVAVAFAVLIALTLLPALLGFLGERMRPKPRIASKALAAKRSGSKRAAAAVRDEATSPTAQNHGGVNVDKGIFAWWVKVVTKVPALTVAIVIAVLGGLAIPAKDLWLALPNSGQHSAGQADRQTFDLISEYFGPGYNGPLIVTVNLLTSTDPLTIMSDLKTEIAALPGVKAVPLATPNENADTGMVQVVPTTGPDDPATGDVVRTLQAQHDKWLKEYGVETAVTGQTAIQLDVSSSLSRALLPFGILVVGLSLLLLMMVFRSVAVPIKATVGYLLSVGAAFGASQLVFNRGWLSQIVNLDRAGPIISFMPILLMGILFGLAMDYEVFLVSRIREFHVHGMEARDAIKAGFVASGKVVAAAAVIMISVFAFFVPEGMGPIKEIAFALALGVAFDAFLVRMTLVPAVLQLLGEKAWWLPRWLDKLLPSFDVEGEGMVKALALQAWPETGRDDPVVTDGLTAGDLFAPLSLHVPRGQVAALTGEVAPVSAALLALSGRLKVDDGRARVAGHLVNHDAAFLRLDVGYLDISRSTHPVQDLDELRQRSRNVVMVDHVDRLTETAEIAALQALIDATTPRGGVVLGARPDADLTSWKPEIVVAVAPMSTVAVAPMSTVAAQPALA